MNKLILVVEDEVRLAGLLRDYLVQAGYEVHCIHSGADVTPWVKANQPTLVLLDQMLPEKDGLTILQEIRTLGDIPVIMATAKTEEIDRLLGLENGADDYICKPFSFREVVSRVKAVLRRGRVKQSYLSHPGITLDESRYMATVFDKTVELTVIEFNLLETLAKSPGRIYSRDHLMSRIYPDGRIVCDRTIDSHVRKLRKKLEQLHPNEELITSVYSAGYKFLIPSRYE